MSTMRVAVAGTCGLALAIAQAIHEHTSHQLLILSRHPQPGLSAQGYQCQVVDYNDSGSLQYSLSGVDTVISTVSGTAQLRLIEAAVACRVPRFAPAEFQGLPHLREENDPLDRGNALALAHLQHYRGYIQSTVFVCGILYERFCVNGMFSRGFGASTGYGNEGDYILDPRAMTAEAPVYNDANELVYLCLTSAHDVGQFVTRALDMAEWPAELTMCGERMSVNDLIEAVRVCRGQEFSDISWQNTAGLQYQLTMAQLQSDIPRQRRLPPVIATAEGRFDFATPALLNTYFPDIQTVGFRDWFSREWGSIS
ncbi:NAD(P)-binding protein [Aaosphaeria arxii CBS 175.79]|uniref:NAD(P)-binding protein n=1 Tax=Aaosphaeria arxii CBS 175.79 TaxID=1450172 RepID=A0A6A5XPL4_9PLEO|nr:NAD(P)-binding protein [Aaosphaeria arxii CBS 175.79]KAF2014777.1 NAD(P)-binding protein [Aaosphaeria arxii CBS 175.79]